MAVTLRSGKARPLTHAEMDANFLSAAQYDVTAYGAVGNGVTDDTAAFTAALAATTGPVFVPWTSSSFVLSALTAANRKRLFGPGALLVGGVATRISSAAWLDNDRAHHRVTNADWQPSKWSSVDGSLNNGAASVELTRTGGYGTYGAELLSLLVSDATPSPEFDVGKTAWVSHQNLTGGQVFGAWFGANSPSNELTQTFSGGSVIGTEVNCGNRWGDNGIKAEAGGTRDFVGLKVVPDVLPAADGATVAIYPGDFGINIAKSIHGHKWWTGLLISVDTIVAGGNGMRLRGGSVLGNAPAALTYADGYYTSGSVYAGNFTQAITVTGTGTTGLKLDSATLSGNAILMATSHKISWGSGASSIQGFTKGITLSIGSGNSGSAADDFNLYCNNFGDRIIQGKYNSAAQIGFLGATPVSRQTVGAALSTGGAETNTNLATRINEIRTALVNLGLVA